MTASDPRPKADLSASREAIDRIDAEFVRLLAERMEAVRAIGAQKREDPATPLRDEKRERLLFERWAAEAEERGLSGYFAGRILREILNYSRRDQERFLRRDSEASTPATLRVGYQGVPGSYSDLTITKVFATRGDAALVRIGFRSFAEVVGALRSGELEYALLPIENTIAGSINEVYDLIAKHDVTVVGEEAWFVEHCLVGLPDATLDGLRVVRSHPVALQQCQVFLDGLVGCVTESYHDTAGAAEAVANEGDPTVAAISSEEAAHHYGLKILRREISDQHENFTRFLLIARDPEPVDPRMPSKTSLVFSINHRRGALLESLRALESHGLNMTKLESRPLPNAPWEYLFYVDIEGAVGEERVDRALELMREHTNRLRVLGSYPRRTGDLRTDEALDSEPHEVPVPAQVRVPRPAAVPGDPSLKLVGPRPDDTRSVVTVGGVELGSDMFALILGPTACGTRDDVLEAAAFARKHRAALLRVGASDPRQAAPFQGLAAASLDHLAEAGRAYELPVATEVVSVEDVARVADRVQLVEVGARSMQNFRLLEALGAVDRPVLLRRGLSATIQELLQAAEIVLAAGNQRVVLCEGGIRTFETALPATLDVSAIPVLKARTHLPVVADPTHAAGSREVLVPLAMAAAAAGADGLVLAVDPRDAHSPGEEELATLFAALEPVLAVHGKRLTG